MQKDDYYIISKESNAVSKVLSDFYIKLGRPSTPLSESGTKLMNILIATWKDLMPKEAMEWKKQRENYKKAELSPKEQVRKHTGRSLASYPMYIYRLMKKLFPEFDATERKNCMKMVKKWPLFQMANKV